MKKILAVVILLLATACEMTPYWDQEIPAAVVSTPVFPIPIGAPVPDVPAVVSADEAVWVRNFPEQLGGEKILALENNQWFFISSCILVDGTEWAYGYTPEYGIFGWVAKRYLEGSCHGNK